MGCRNCVGSSCNGCLLKRSIKTGIVFFIVSSPPVVEMTGGNVFVRTALFMAIVFLLMKLSKMRSGYTLRPELDMSKARPLTAVANLADF
jgi:hypothetical protein